MYEIKVNKKTGYLSFCDKFKSHYKLGETIKNNGSLILSLAVDEDTKEIYLYTPKPENIRNTRGRVIDITGPSGRVRSKTFSDLFALRYTPTGDTFLVKMEEKSIKDSGNELFKISHIVDLETEEIPQKENESLIVNFLPNIDANAMFRTLNMKVGCEVKSLPGYIVRLTFGPNGEYVEINVNDRVVVGYYIHSIRTIIDNLNDYVNLEEVLELEENQNFLEDFLEEEEVVREERIMPPIAEWLGNLNFNGRDRLRINNEPF